MDYSAVFILNWEHIYLFFNICSVFLYWYLFFSVFDVLHPCSPVCLCHLYFEFLNIVFRTIPGLFESPMWFLNLFYFWHGTSFAGLAELLYLSFQLFILGLMKAWNWIIQLYLCLRFDMGLIFVSHVLTFNLFWVFNLIWL